MGPQVDALFELQAIAANLPVSQATAVPLNDHLFGITRRIAAVSNTAASIHSMCSQVVADIGGGFERKACVDKGLSVSDAACLVLTA
ncbi:MAG: hypothetical protein R3C19_08855 [Planctomycetaceae bacterium]